MEEFRGHADECLRHFSIFFAGRVRKGSKEADVVKQPLAKFCGVSTATVARWLREPSVLPTGAYLIRLMCFFDCLGYRVIELERMTPGLRMVSELVGYGVTRPEDVASQLGYANKDGVYRVIEGRAGISNEREQKMWDVFKSLKEELEEKKLQAKEQFRDYPAVSGSESKSPGVQISTKTKSSTSYLSSVLHQMEALDLNLQEIRADRLINSLDDHGREVVLRLYAHLTDIGLQIVTRREKGGS